MSQVKTEKLNQLFGEWIENQISEPAESLEKTKILSENIKAGRFCMDGIIDEAVFEQESVKVLFISAEANVDAYTDKDAEISDRREAFLQYAKEGKDDFKGKMRERLCEMYRYITGNENMPTEQAALHFAMMNINKRGGGKTIDYKVLKAYCNRYKNRILREIEIIDPDLIVWVGYSSFPLAKGELGAKTTEKGNTVLQLANGSKAIPVIPMWHTSYYQAKIEPAEGYTNKTVGKLIAKLKLELSKAGWQR